jgi:hypothetical protein
MHFGPPELEHKIKYSRVIRNVNVERISNVSETVSASIADIGLRRTASSRITSVPDNGECDSLRNAGNVFHISTSDRLRNIYCIQSP